MTLRGERTENRYRRAIFSATSAAFFAPSAVKGSWGANLTNVIIFGKAQ